MSSQLADMISLDRARRLRADQTGVERDVATWPCRSCGARVGVGQSALEWLAFFNGILKARRERPIDSSEVMFCAPCAALWHEDAQLKTRRRL